MKDLVPEALRESVGADASPVFLWEERIPRKTMMVFPRDAEVDLYGVLIEGEVSVMADDIKEKQKRIYPWIAFRAPGAGVNLFAKEPTRIILAIVSRQPNAPVVQAIQSITQKRGAVAWSKRPSPVVSIELNNQPDLSWGGGAYHAHLGFDGTSDGAPTASVAILSASKNAPIPEHVHASEWEMLAVIEGDGFHLTKKPSAGALERLRVSPGALISVPPGVPHGWEPAGTQALTAIQLYSPPGPEQRFRKLATPPSK
ncbi:MAG: hypothetical protein NVS3B20_13080 [Polyangiales bacterium]